MAVTFLLALAALAAGSPTDVASTSDATEMAIRKARQDGYIEGFVAATARSAAINRDAPIKSLAPEKSEAERQYELCIWRLRTGLSESDYYLRKTAEQCVGLLYLANKQR